MGTDQQAHGREEQVAGRRPACGQDEQASEMRDRRSNACWWMVNGPPWKLTLSAGTCRQLQGKPATGKEIRVPYSVIYELEGEQHHRAAHLHVRLEGIIRQLED